MRSSEKVIGPWVVTTFTVAVPVVATLPFGGWPTFFVAASLPFVYVQSPFAAVVAEADGVGAAAGAGSLPPSCVTSRNTAPTTRITPNAAAVIRLRRRRAWAAS